MSVEAVLYALRQVFPVLGHSHPGRLFAGAFSPMGLLATVLRLAAVLVRTMRHYTTSAALISRIRQKVGDYGQIVAAAI